MTTNMEKEFYNLSISVSKALNESETPLKMKHARNVIIATHRMKEVKSLWVILIRQSLMEHRFSAWKFCHILHKVMREGHPVALKQSLTHKKLILEVGKLWGHLQDDVGPCIKFYTKLLVQKLDFHEKYPIFPGPIAVDFDDIVKYASTDMINVYFQLCIEIFDYLDCIINLQDNIFTSINTFRMSSMTPQGQCRLAPLITLIQDANPLYDMSVRVMFKLHDKLPDDVLIGHRERFHVLFNKLKYFYDNVRPLQYFADVVQLPSLPDVAPNFLSQVELGNYVAPLMLIETEATESTTIDNNSEMDANLNDTISPYNTSLDQNIIEEKEAQIKRLQEELSEKDNQLQNEQLLLQKFNELNLQNNTLQRIVAETEEKLQLSLQEKCQLETKIQENLTNTKHETKEWEEKSLIFEEKFQKMKIMYAKLRDEHVNLLRMNGEEKKSMQYEKKNINSLKAEIDELYEKIKHIETNSQKHKNEYDNSLKEKSDEINRLKRDIQEEKIISGKMQQENNVLKLQYEKQLTDKDKCIEKYDHLIKSEKGKYVLLTNEMDKCRKTLNEKDEMLILSLQENQAIRDRLSVCNISLTKLDREINIAQNEVKLSHSKIKNSQEQVNTLLSGIQNIYENLNGVIMTTLKDTHFTSEQLLGDIDHILLLLKELCVNCVTTHSPTIINDVAIFTGNDLHIKIINLTLYFVSYHHRIIYISNSTTELLQAEEFLKKHDKIRASIFDFYNIFCKHGKDDGINNELLKVSQTILIPQFIEMKELLIKLQATLSENFNPGDMLQQELKMMDKIIEEATQRIRDVYYVSRDKTKGLKLELNEKILDSCTILMHAIKELILKSRHLQEEILQQGRGGYPLKEFYKRNSQWTEGLISAAKNVAKAANYLVDAANKFFNSEKSNNFEIVVAAQEIAASTVQLVIASKVKANKDSDRLKDLTTASRVVSEATGEIVAAVEGRNQQLAIAEDIDIAELNSSKMKAKEMEMHVKVLELEVALQNERYKLTSYRKACYQNSQLN